jgi:type IV pilus assembly protein PilA
MERQTMFNKKGFTLVELMIVVAIIGILAAIAIPNFVDMQYRAKRAEVPGNVDGIKTAQIAYDAAFDKYIEVSDWKPSDEIAKTQRDWSTGTGFDTLGWGPDGKVRGRYKVTSKSTTDFLVTGECDVDNDDTEASFTATKSINTKMNTGASVY